jgi:hypothetical protein
LNERIREIRIREIADEAFKGLGTNPVYATAMIYASKELEKFAELIVKECASVVAEHFDSSEPWITPKTILYHFGVEE